MWCETICAKGVIMPNKSMLRSIGFIAALALMGCIELVEGHQPTAYITVRPVNTGQTYVPLLRLLRTPIAGRVQSVTVHRVAIFPFADYSHQQSFIEPLTWGANRIIIETLTDRFIAHGISVALQEDVEALLAADGLLRPPPRSDGVGNISPREQFAQRVYVSNTPEYELIWGKHDSEMRDEITRMVQEQDYLRSGGSALFPSGEPSLQGVIAGLSRERVMELGRLLDVDLIIRGRILESGFTPSDPRASVVQIRIYAQDAKSGELFWSNRSEFEVRPGSSWFSPVYDPRVVYDRAVQEVVSALMADFFGEL
jgi:hypothetical protein